MKNNNWEKEFSILFTDNVLPDGYGNDLITTKEDVEPLMNFIQSLLDQQKAEIVEKEKCWPWGGSTDGNGYGQVMVNGKPYRAHRLMYELVHKGEELPPKSSGLTIDHICRNRSCINPNHLEIVTNRENVLRGNGLTAINHRKTHCTKGHPLSGANLYLYQKGNTIERSCRECRRVCRRAWKAKQKEKSKDDIIKRLEGE